MTYNELEILLDDLEAQKCALEREVAAIQEEIDGLAATCSYMEDLYMERLFEDAWDD